MTRDEMIHDTMGVARRYGISLPFGAPDRASAPNPVKRRTLSAGDVLYLGLAVTGWMATTVLTAAGLFVVLFLMAGNGSFAGFFEQVALLATHYGQVEPILRATFDTQLMIAIALTFVATAFFRRASLISIFRSGGVDGPR